MVALVAAGKCLFSATLVSRSRSFVVMCTARSLTRACTLSTVRFCGSTTAAEAAAVEKPSTAAATIPTMPILRAVLTMIPRVPVGMPIRLLVELDSRRFAHQDQQPDLGVLQMNDIRCAVHE